MEGWRRQEQPKDGFTPFSSNVVTYQERALLPMGTYSVSQNTRDYRPGLKKRAGLDRLDIYPYLGDVVDVRPAYNDPANDEGTFDFMIINGINLPFYPSIAACQTGTADITVDAEDDSGNYGPGVYTTGDGTGWGMGRLATSYNLKRFAGYTPTVIAASMFILLVDNPSLATGAADFGLMLCEGTWPPPDVCSDDKPDWRDTFNVGNAWSDRKSITIAEYLDDYIVEIPFNAAGIAAINAEIANDTNVLTVVQREYDIEYSTDDDGLGFTLDTDAHYIEQRMDRYFPFIRLTFDEAPACTSIFQYNQMRSGNQEILAYFSNGDILTGYNDGDTAVTDSRTSATGGDNSGYYPWSDGTPSSSRGRELSRAGAPSYDSKWGDFAYRVGGLSAQQDWENCPSPEPTISNSPPSWGVLDDVLIIADGQGYAKFYGGEAGQPVKASIVRETDATDTGIFNDEWDADGISVDIPSGWAGNTSAFYLFTPIWATRFLVTMTSANSGSGVLAVSTWNGAAWAGVAEEDVLDGTEVAGSTLKQTGQIDIYPSAVGKPTRLNGLTGYWLKFTTDSATTYATFTVKALYDFQELTNIWDGILVDAVESKYFDNSVGASGTYFTYANTAIDVSLMTSSDYVYFSTFDKPEQLYFDVGSTPNSGAVIPTLAFEYYDGDSWVTWDVVKDNTNGLTRSGFVVMDWTDVDLSQKQAFQGSLWSSHWFRMSVNQTMGDDMRISIQYYPILDIADFGTNTECMAVWKERCVYSFDKYPSWIYVTKNGTFNVLNGDDYAVLQAGDGRRHSVVAMHKFHNELMVWQEEKGKEGGCLTLFEGYSPATFGKLVLSSKIGTLNAQSVVIIDGALEASRTDYKAATVAYFISNYGIYMSDGQTVVSISAAIQNYFDPGSSECIRNGYQDKCWLAHDPTHQVLRMGLVTGSTATEPNIFPVYDLITRRWSFDAYGGSRVVRCISEVSGSSSSAVQVIVMAGTSDGKIYNASSTNLNDGGDTAIDMQVRIELNDGGKLLNLSEVAVRLKRQALGNCLFTAYENGVLNTEYSKTVDMTGGSDYVVGDENVVERLILAVNQEDMISINFGNAVIDQDMYLFDFWLDADALQNR